MGKLFKEGHHSKGGGTLIKEIRYTYLMMQKFIGLKAIIRDDLGMKLKLCNLI